MGGACGAYEGGESCAQGSGLETSGKENNGETQTYRIFSNIIRTQIWSALVLADFLNEKEISSRFQSAPFL